MYTPPSHIAVVNHSSLIKDEDCALIAEALCVQLRDHACPAWGFPTTNVAFYGHAEHVPLDQNAVLAFVDDDGNAESAGYHADIAGMVYGLVDVRQSNRPSVTASHEALEIVGNAHLNRQVPGPNGRRYWMELCDPVQRDTYQIEVEGRKVDVSDFVLPAWFSMVNPFDIPQIRTTWLQQPLTPFEIGDGGYQIAEDVDGQILFMSEGPFGMRPTNHSRTSRIRMGQPRDPEAGAQRGG